MLRTLDYAILAAVTEVFTHCAVCGERIGVYEPLVVTDGARRVTSLTREPLLQGSGLELSHETCAQRGTEEPEQEQHSSDALGYARADYPTVTRTDTP